MATMIPDMQAVENRTDKSLQNLLVFRLGAQAYALSIEVVVQIIPMMKLTSLPQSDVIIEGVANIRGKITPVMNVRRRLGMQPIPARLHTPIILVRLGNRLIGMIVDEVIDILSLPAEQIAHPDQILPDGMEFSKVIEGVIFLENHNILMLNPFALAMPAVPSLRSNYDTLNTTLVNQRFAARDTASIEDGLPGFDALDDVPFSTAAADCPEDNGGTLTEQRSTPQKAGKTSHRKRSHARTEKVLADQVAALAADFPEVNGESQGNGSGENSPADSELPAGQA